MLSRIDSSVTEPLTGLFRSIPPVIGPEPEKAAGTPATVSCLLVGHGRKMQPV